MRKQIIQTGPSDRWPTETWLDLERAARVELTSEDAAHPIESALLPGGGAGWRAAEPGTQTIRLLFDEPQHLRRIRLHFIEPAAERTQEFALRWSMASRLIGTAADILAYRPRVFTVDVVCFGSRG